MITLFAQENFCGVFSSMVTYFGVFPDSWRERIVIPLHKKGDKNDVNNYRGITLLSCFSKLFTTVLDNRVVTFCNSNTCISDAQFGFKKRLFNR